MSPGRLSWARLLALPWTPILLQAALLLAAMTVFDRLIAERPFGPQLLWGPMDSLFHGAIAGLLVLPLIAGRPERRILALWAMIPAVLIDLDHFVAARSWSLEEAVSLPCRPWSHSLTFAVLLSGVWLLSTRQRLKAAVIFAALASHVLRDAAGGGCTPVLWPARLSGIPHELYLSGTLVLGASLTVLRFLSGEGART